MKGTRKQVVSPKVGEMPTEEKAQILTIVQNTNAENVADADYKVLGSEPKTKLNLDETFKVIELLHQKKRFRDRLDTYIDLLNSFEVELKQEDLDKDSYYTGCSLVLSDDRGGKFTLKNPILIRDVIEFLTLRMSVKLAEIESEIVLPN